MWSCRIVAQFLSWSMIFQGVVMATHNKMVESVKLSSVNEKRNKLECAGSPSKIQWPSRVWSEKDLFLSFFSKNSKQRMQKSSLFHLWFMQNEKWQKLDLKREFFTKKWHLNTNWYLGVQNLKIFGALSEAEHKIFFPLRSWKVFNELLSYFESSWKTQVT